MKTKNLISMNDLTKEDIGKILENAEELKDKQFGFSGKSATLLFNRPSTRTLVSFEVALNQMGFSSIHLDYVFTQLVKGERLRDTAKTLSQYVSLIIARLTPADMLLELTQSSLVPIINAGSDIEHPCQALGDLYTMKKLSKLEKGNKIVFVGDPTTNIANSLSIAGIKSGLNFVFLAPKGYYPNKEYYENSKKLGNLEITADIKSALKDADIIYTSSWAKANDNEISSKIKDFLPYQVNENMLSFANKEAIVMHPLPASRGLEISENVLDGKQSVVWQQVKNRLYVQKAIIKMLL